MADPLAIAADVQRLIDSGRLQQAEATLRRALARAPADPTLNQVMALLLTRLARADQAVHFATRAVAAAPDAAELHYTLGLCHSNTAEAERARAAFLRAAQLAPDEPKYHLALARLDVDAFRPAPAEEALTSCLRLAPGWPPAVTLLAQLRTITGRMHEAVAILRDAARAHPNDPGIHHLLCTTLHYPSDVSSDEILRVHRFTAALYPSAPPAPLPPSPSSPSAPLRVGFLSRDLQRHSVAYFLLPLLEHRAVGNFKAFCYSEGGATDDMTARLRAGSDGWCASTQLDDDALFSRMRADRLDVLVDLLGHFVPERMAFLARRPAPVIINWLAYPATSGHPAVTHRFVDAVTDPPGAERWATEQLVRLPGCFVCYSPEPTAPAIRPRDAARPPTFGSFNNAAKLSEHSLDLWAAILTRVPASRLFLKAGTLHDGDVAAALRARFTARGVDGSRIDIAGRTESAAGHLAMYHNVDVALDPTPYNGTTTTCEALWMGVPVVTRAGDRHAARVGASLLTAVGLPDLIADSAEHYIDLAAGLIADASRLASLRAGLRGQMQRSPLCDGPAFGRAFGSALRHIALHSVLGDRPSASA